MRATAVLLALAGSALGQTQAAGGTRAAAGSAAAAGAPSAPAGARIDVRGLALNAFPEIGGLSRPTKVQGQRVPIVSHPKIQNSRAGFIRGSTFARIGDLPQVKPIVAFTNRIVSRAEASRNPTGTKVPTAPGKLRPARPEDPELARRIAEFRTNPGTEAARQLAPYVWTPMVRRTIIGPGVGGEDQRISRREGSPPNPIQISHGTVPSRTVAANIAVNANAATQAHRPAGTGGASPDPKRRKVIEPSFAGMLVAPQGSMLDELNDSWSDTSCAYTGPRPTADQGPLDPRLVDSFTMGLHKDALDGQGHAPPPPPGTVGLREGDLVGAARELIDHLDAEPADAGATRTMALVILLRDVPESAEKSMLEAYRLDPALASQPISSDDLPVKADLRDLVISAVNRANKTNTPQSWLMVSVLMQAQGRGENAARMVARARSVGLDPAIADAFDAQLARQ